MGDKYLELVREANKYFDISDHMLTITYPLVNDTKIILTVVDNLYKALINGIDALISHSYYYKKVSGCPSDVEGKIEMFKQLAEKSGFNRESFILIKDLKVLVEHRKDSPMEFSRGGSHVLADRNYRLKMINLNKAKSFVQEAKVFIERLNKFFEYNRNQRRFL